MKNTKHKELLVVKVGTDTLTTKDHQGNMKLNSKAFARIADQITRMKHDSRDIVIVSSAARAAGIEVHDGHAMFDDVTEVQRLCSVGQVRLIQKWQESLEGSVVGQLLLTEQDFSGKHAANLRSVMARSFLHGDIVVVNENDSLSHEEITFGDNDGLAATLACFLNESGVYWKASLVILSNIDGLLSNIHDKTSVIAKVSNVRSVMHLATDTTSDGGKGGMKSKLLAADRCLRGNVHMHIANGSETDAIGQTLAGNMGTRFY